MKQCRTYCYLALASAAAMAISVVACGAKSTNAAIPEGHGQLTVALTDAPAPEVKAITVTIDGVSAHAADGGWVTVSDKTVTVDLLKLKDSSMDLGFANLPPGKVTQIRLHLSESGPQSITLLDGSTATLKVPSGTESGIKINGPFDILACNRTHVTLDFDGHKSIFAHPTGHDNEWILRPVIHAKDVSTVGAECVPVTPPSDAGLPDAGPPTETPPTLGQVGSPCTSGNACLSGACTEGTCAKGGPGAPCQASTDCTSEICAANGTCGPGNAGGTGSACTVPSDCLSSACTNQVCDSGGQGTPCVVANDCATGFSCSSNFCEPSLN